MIIEKLQETSNAPPSVERITLYLPREMKKQLEIEAAKNMRSLNKQVVFFLSKGALHPTTK
jgi:Tfp pilus assembly ATPase PilU